MGWIIRCGYLGTKGMDLKYENMTVPVLLLQLHLAVDQETEKWEELLGLLNRASVFKAFKQPFKIVCLCGTILIHNR